MAFFDDFVWADFEVALNFGIVKLAADETLDAINSVFWIGDAMALGDLTNEALAFFGDGNYRWGSAVAFGVSDNFWFAGNHVSEC